MTLNDKKIPKIPTEFSCETCDYISCNKKDYRRHIATDKHIMLYNAIDNAIEKTPDVYTCHCDKVYRHYSSLSRHKQTCKVYKPSDDINNTDEKTSNDDVSLLKEMLFEMINQNKELQKTIIEQNKELQKTVIEQNKTMQDIIPKIGNGNNTNSNNTNNIVVNNLTLLNTNCKDAMSLSEFIDSIPIDVKDLVFTSEKGLTNGITTLFLDNYNKLPIEMRPLWCCDKKRKKIYVKDDEWHEDINNTKTKNAIKSLTAKQAKNSNKYIKENPDWMQHDKKKEKYINIVQQTTMDMNDGKQLDVINNLLDTVHLTNETKLALKSN